MVSRRASGRFVIRIDPKVHEHLRKTASQEGISMNELCARKLSSPSDGLAAHPGLTAAVARAVSLHGTDLIGVAVFGSWTRGEALDSSDVDLLIVLEKRVPLVRVLYRRWDETPLREAGRRLEPQFVHLPDSGETVAGIWAEAALDGIVLYEKGLRLSGRLVQVRHDIVSGRIARRTAHGQPYWVRNEEA